MKDYAKNTFSLAELHTIVFATVSYSSDLNNVIELAPSALLPNEVTENINNQIASCESTLEKLSGGTTDFNSSELGVIRESLIFVNSVLTGRTNAPELLQDCKKHQKRIPKVLKKVNRIIQNAKN